MSFSADTKVLLATGVAVPIASLQPGDKVLATDTRTGKTSAEPVTAVLVHHDTDRYDLMVRTGHHTTVIHTTDSHLFWDQTTHTWTEAAALRHNSRLQTPDGAIVEAVAGVIPEASSGDMWDLSVAGDHDFYVSAGSADVLVHNCPAPPESTPPDAGEPNRWSKQPWEDIPPREQWQSGTSAPQPPRPSRQSRHAAATSRALAEGSVPHGTDRTDHP